MIRKGSRRIAFLQSIAHGGWARSVPNEATLDGTILNRFRFRGYIQMRHIKITETESVTEFRITESGQDLLKEWTR